MNIRIDCTVEGHEGEWVEYRPIRLRERREYIESQGEDEIWATVRGGLSAWTITDEDGKPLPEITADTTLEELEEMSDLMLAWLISSFTRALEEGRLKALSTPFSEPSP